jgi:quercetin dioxygenase-like cupin family protein
MMSADIPLQNVSCQTRQKKPAETGEEPMSQTDYQIRQLSEEISPPDSGKKSVILLDDDSAKVVLFAFAAGSGLTEHVAPLPAIIQIIQGEAHLTAGPTAVKGRPGTWIQMAPRTPHSIQAETPVIMQLTIFKNAKPSGA